MYEYIIGLLAQVSPTQAVLETGGIGYSISISLQTYSLIHESKDNVKLWIHPIVREDAHLLYGFATRDEREIFRLLIGVTGVGPNTALIILSGMNNSELRNTLVNGDVARLKSIKGIGLKTAERMIVDLRDKMAKLGLEDTTGVGLSGTYGATLASSTTGTEAASALQLLGFAKAPVEKMVGQLLLENPAYSLEELIKRALKLL